jgi:hypothetical protein
MSDKPGVRINTDQPLSPETKAMLEDTPEDAPLADALEPDTEHGASVGLPVASLPTPDPDEGERGSKD